MKNSNAIVLGLGVAIALVLSLGAVYGMMGQTAPQQSAYIGGVPGVSGYGGGMMGRNSAYSGGMMGGYPGYQGYAGGMMGSNFGYPRGMMGAYGGMMGSGGMMAGGYHGYRGNGSSPTWNGQSGGALVIIAHYGFYPPTLTVAKGTTVTWVNMDFVQHTVTSGSEQAPTGLFDSHELGHMQGFSHTFDTPGTYIYYCDVHPNMTGTVVVTG